MGFVSSVLQGCGRIITKLDTVPRLDYDYERLASGADAHAKGGQPLIPVRDTVLGLRELADGDVGQSDVRHGLFGACQLGTNWAQKSRE